MVIIATEGQALPVGTGAWLMAGQRPAPSYPAPGSLSEEHTCQHGDP